MVRTARINPGRRGHLEAGTRDPQRPRHRQVGQSLIGRDHVHDVGDDAETRAHVHNGGADGGPQVRIEDQADGVRFAADGKRQDIQFRFVRGDRLADLEHVRTEHLVTRSVEVVGVILHKADAAL